MELLNYETLKKSGYDGYILEKAPEKVLQFGEGNFLRGFVDYWFDLANEKAGCGAGWIIRKTFGNESRSRKSSNKPSVQTGAPPPSRPWGRPLISLAERTSMMRTAVARSGYADMRNAGANSRIGRRPIKFDS